MPRKILHLDLDAFFCAVEEQLDPALRGVAFAVGGRPEGRGVVASCSYPARQFGVRSAMPMAQALRLCPPLLIRPHHFPEYRRASEAVMERLRALTPFVQPISIDEAFLDVTLLPDDAEAIARRLQATINGELGLPCSLGVASNKLVAKIANNLGKDRAGKAAPPNAITIVPPGQEAAFLAPLPVRELWGVGPRTAEQLARLGVRTIGELAARREAELVHRFGKHGAEMSQHARGIDERPVADDGEAKSISKETTFAHDVRDGETLRRVLRRHADEVAHRLRQEGLRGGTVKLKLRWADFTTFTRQTTLPTPSQHDDDIYQAALALFEKAWPAGRPVRLIGVGVSGLSDGAVQPGLFEAAADAQQTKLEATLDELRQRFGSRIVRRASTLPPEE